MSEETEQQKRMSLIWIPLAAFALFMLPLLSTALQIELQLNSSIPLHWLMVLSALIGGGISTIIQVIKKIYEKNEAELLKQVEDLKTEIRTISLERDIREKDIILNVYKWNENNKEIENLEKQLKKE